MSARFKVGSAKQIETESMLGSRLAVCFVTAVLLGVPVLLLSSSSFFYDVLGVLSNSKSTYIRSGLYTA